MLKQLSTNEGQDKKGDVYLLLAFIQPVVYAMSPGWGQVVVGSIALVILAILSYKTVGNIPPEQAEIIQDKIDQIEILGGEDLLEMGRRR